MTDFKRELRQSLHELSGTAPPGLAGRVRGSLREASGGGDGPHWALALAATTLAVVVIAVLVLVRAGLLPPPAPVPGAAPSPTPSPTPSVQAAPLPAPSASPRAFLCTQQSPVTTGSRATGVADVRTGAQDGYDRFVIEFRGGLPSTYEVRFQNGTTFTRSPRGDTVTLEGSAGLLVRVTGLPMPSGYSGPQDLTPHDPVLREAALLEDFEGIFQWGLGLSGPACVSVFTLDGPPRLVIDVRTA